MDIFPSAAPHWHLLLNHFPSIGGVFALGLLVASYYVGSIDLRKAGLVAFVVIGLLTIPTFITGAAAGWRIQGQEGISWELIVHHMDAAIVAFSLLLISAWLAWIALWQYRRFSAPNKLLEPGVLVFGVLSILALIRVGTRGGDINHPEIAHADALAAASNAPEFGLAASIENFTIGSQFIWPIMEAIHFMGMAVLFGPLVLIAMRMFGLARNLSFASLHRLLPMAVFGFMVNVITGMMFFVSNSGRYVAMTDTFYPKMALIVIGGCAVLYYTIFDRPWALKPEEEAPMLSKGVAAATVIMWTAVLVYGRWLPYGAGG